MKSQSSPSTANTNAGNPLGIAPTGRLLAKFAIPAIISMLVNALYNIVDQIFIGQGVGMLGNAATNIAFPVTTISTAAALLLGIGGASNYNLEMGAGRDRKASEIAGKCLIITCYNRYSHCRGDFDLSETAAHLLWSDGYRNALCN